MSYTIPLFTIPLTSTLRDGVRIDYPERYLLAIDLSVCNIELHLAPAFCFIPLQSARRQRITESCPTPSDLPLSHIRGQATSGLGTVVRVDLWSLRFYKLDSFLEWLHPFLGGGCSVVSVAARWRGAWSELCGFGHGYVLVRDLDMYGAGNTLDFFHVDLDVFRVLIGTRSETLHNETINEDLSKITLVHLQARVPSGSSISAVEFKVSFLLYSVSTPCATSLKTLSVLSHTAPPRTAYRYKLPENRPGV